MANTISPTVESPVSPAPARARNDAIDILRGLVMVVMALDHARDFTMSHGDLQGLTDPATTTVPLFFTRWITHFCAPVFVLLAGVGAALARSKRTPRELAWFLVSRGLWLVLLEVTVVRFGFMLDLSYHFVVLQVIWVIGWSMVLLAPFAFLPPSVAGVFGVVTICAHNLLDGTHPSALGWLWYVLHAPRQVQPLPWMHVMVAYTIIPWMGVMAAGFGLGAALPRDVASRRRLFARLGAGLTIAFVILRAVNVYGDPSRWSSQPRGAVYTLLSFLNCTKYPPSLAYLLMTLGPSLLLLAWLEGKALGRLSGWLRTFGRVPLFFYLLHLPVLHLVTFVGMGAKIFDPAYRAQLAESGPGWPLWSTYVVWAVSIVALYVPCRWFAGVKQRSRNPWLSYL
jgi:uncharacterized membrane protein